jgi:hypothetical protein
MSLSASVCSRLQHQHETIYELLNGFSEEQLRQRIHKDKWSSFEQVTHLVSYQPVFLQRMKIIQQENDPLLHEAHHIFSIFMLTRSADPGYNI